MTPDLITEAIEKVESNHDSYLIIYLNEEPFLEHGYTVEQLHDDRTQDELYEALCLYYVDQGNATIFYEFLD